MAEKNISLERILMQQNFQFLLGVPYSRVPLIGTIDGTNKDFKLPSPYYPIYPQGDATITPTVSDLLVEGLKTGVYTPLTVASLNTIVAPETGNTVLGSAELSTAPAIASATSILGTGVEQLEPMVCQGFDPSPKQDQKKVGRLASTDQLYGFGAIDLTIKSSMVTSHSSIDLMDKLFMQPYSGSGVVETGYDASEWVPSPKALFGSLLITDPDTQDIIGFFKMQKCMANPDMPSIGDGKEGFQP